MSAHDSRVSISVTTLYSSPDLYVEQRSSEQPTRVQAVKIAPGLYELVGTRDDAGHTLTMTYSRRDRLWLVRDGGAQLFDCFDSKRAALDALSALFCEQS